MPELSAAQRILAAIDNNLTLTEPPSELSERVVRRPARPAVRRTSSTPAPTAPVSTATPGVEPGEPKERVMDEFDQIAQAIAEGLRRAKDEKEREREEAEKAERDRITAGVMAVVIGATPTEPALAGSSTAVAAPAATVGETSYGPDQRPPTDCCRSKEGDREVYQLGDEALIYGPGDAFQRLPWSEHKAQKQSPKKSTLKSILKSHYVRL